MAEDNSINQRVGKLILQRAGYLIDLVGDGSEAVEAHRSEPYEDIPDGLPDANHGRIRSNAPDPDQ